jgi:hypothetical protein
VTLASWAISSMLSVRRSGRLLTDIRPRSWK